MGKILLPSLLRVESVVKIRTDGSRTILRDLLRIILVPAVKKYSFETGTIKLPSVSGFHGLPSKLIADIPAKKLVP